MAVFPAVSLDGGLIFKQGYHDISIVNHLLLVDHHHIPGQDAGLQHGFSPDFESEMFACEAAGVKCQVFFNVLLGQNGRAGRHIAQQGNLVPAVVGPVCDRNSTGFSFRLGDKSRLAQPLEVKVDGGRGF